MKQCFAVLLAAAACVCSFSKPVDAGELKLWYAKPAKEWVEALPIGNGRFGAMIFGGISEERIQLNEDTLWSGGPREWNNDGARETLPEIRKLVFEHKYIEADKLSKRMMGPYTESYMPMGNLYIRFENSGETGNYYRELNISSAVAATHYTAGGVKYSREIFASFPDQVIVVRLTADRPHSITFTATLDSLLRFKVAPSGDTLILTGKAPKHVAPNYTALFNGVLYADNEFGEGMNFDLRVKAVTESGKVKSDANGLHVSGASAATLLISAATSFNGPDKSPGYEGKKPGPIAAKYLKSASKKSYLHLKTAHTKDYQRLFNRVSLNVGDAPEGAEQLPTDERVAKYGGGDPELVELLFQYGRYLLIASSRPGSQPANLQGIWNDLLRPPWSSNYTININTEMNYWPAEVTNLSECHKPLLDFIAGLAAHGRKTAEINYGCRGWVAHHNSDVWQQTGPVGGYGDGDPVWALWPMGGAWLSFHLWEHYAFTGDKRYLKKAYPIMKGAAEFLLDWLVDDGQGHLVTNPSTSPEHKFVAPTKQKSKAYVSKLLGVSGVAAVSMASTMDMSIIREVFTNCIESSEVLGIDTAFRARLRETYSKLLPIGIAKDGRLMEWSVDFDDPEPQHRHFSHLISVHPGRLITKRRTPELFEAAKKSMIARGDGGTGWSLGWKINHWARYGDGDHAMILVGNLLITSQRCRGIE